MTSLTVFFLSIFIVLKICCSSSVQKSIDPFDDKKIEQSNDERQKRDTYEYNYNKSTKTETIVNWSVKRTETGKYQNNLITNGPETVTEACLKCICEDVSRCSQYMPCDDVSGCGPYLITRAYWADAGKPTLPGVGRDSPDAYSSCTSDFQCAADTVRGYMRKLGQDCNGDGVVNCYDYMAIHRLGGYRCDSYLHINYPHTFHPCVARQ